MKYLIPIFLAVAVLGRSENMPMNQSMGEKAVQSRGSAYPQDFTGYGPRRAATPGPTNQDLMKQKSKPLLPPRKLKTPKPHPDTIAGTCLHISDSPGWLELSCPALELHFESAKGDVKADTKTSHGNFSLPISDGKDYYITSSSKAFQLVPAKSGPYRRGDEVILKAKVIATP